MQEPASSGTKYNLVQKEGRSRNLPFAGFEKK